MESKPTFECSLEKNRLSEGMIWEESIRQSPMNSMFPQVPLVHSYDNFLPPYVGLCLKMPEDLLKNNEVFNKAWREKITDKTSVFFIGQTLPEPQKIPILRFHYWAHPNASQKQYNCNKNVSAQLFSLFEENKSLKIDGKIVQTGGVSVHPGVSPSGLVPSPHNFRIQGVDWKNLPCSFVSWASIQGGTSALTIHTFLTEESYKLFSYDKEKLSQTSKFQDWLDSLGEEQFKEHPDALFLKDLFEKIFI